MEFEITESTVAVKVSTALAPESHIVTDSPGAYVGPVVAPLVQTAT